MRNLASRTARGAPRRGGLLLSCLAVLACLPLAARGDTAAYLEAHCTSCHDRDTKKAGLDLTALKADVSQPDVFARWVKVHDRIASGEMPPPARKRPPAADARAAQKWIHDLLVKEDVRKAKEGRTRFRRLTRVEYEHTVRDLLDLPGLPLAGELPADGSAHGFDNNGDALDVSHVNLAKYVEAADRALDVAVATRPRAPAVVKQRISLANPHGFVAHVLMHGDGVLLKDRKPDPDFPPAGAHQHIDQGAHERMGSFRTGSSVGLFRHEDESFHPYFIEFVTIYPGHYRVETSLWAFQWDKGKVLPARGTEAARLSIVHLTGDGRGGGHPSDVLGYFDAPSLKEQVHEFTTWLNPKDIIGYNAASLAPGANTRGKMRAMGFTGPGIACDYLDVEGPIHAAWPPRSHKALFGDLPLVEFKQADHPKVRAPKRAPDRQLMFMGKNKADPIPGVWTVQSKEPLADADRLLGKFLPRAFRRPVPAEVREQYVGLVDRRLKAGDCFETAMRFAYRAALCSPDFLYHVEPARMDQHALACRLSYFFWRSMPDDRLTRLADDGKLSDAGVLKAEADRLLKDARSARFVEDFLGQWLKLRQIASNDPDRKLYPEFSAYLQDSTVAETRAYFRELLDRDLDASHVIKSDFAMLNQKLAAHYGVPGVSGSQVRRVKLPADSVRGGFMTQASVLRITANGTTTSPVPRGAFFMERILGKPPEPPPPNVAAVEPDVRGATTIRDQLAKHRDNPSCVSCHAKIDPPGFALESFDVIGGYRERYRSIGKGEPAPRGNIDPFIGIGFRLGPKVDASGTLADGRSFRDVREFRDLVAADKAQLLRNLTQQFAVYGAARSLSFADRDEVEAVVSATQRNGGGVRTLIRELIASPLFSAR